jgi:hypothetical protein
MCKNRKAIFSTDHPSSSLINKNYMIVRTGLFAITNLDMKSNICFGSIHTPFLTNNVEFQKTIAKYWPFILGEDGELLGVNIILEKLQQMIKEENYPKSANKK